MPARIYGHPGSRVAGGVDCVLDRRFDNDTARFSGATEQPQDEFVREAWRYLLNVERECIGVEPALEASKSIGYGITVAQFQD